MSSRAISNIDFMGVRKIAALISIILVLGAAVSLGVRGLALGLDFTGGSLVELDYAEAPDLTDVRQSLNEAGFEGPMVQNFGSDTAVLIRLPATFDDSVGEEVVSALSQGQDISLQRSEYVGGQVGKELREKGGLALLLAFFVVLVYVAMRFQLKFGLASVVPLVHDVLLVLGVFSVFQLTFDLTVLAALLAVIGYSLNDTIVVSDRIRENFRRILKGGPEEIINTSLNQVLTRTLVTSGTTLVVLIALLVFGGEMIRNFALALSVGVVVGTYSSIYVAANMLVVLGVNRDDLYVPKKEGAGDEQPETEEPPDWLKRME
ncbi:protein translocase subunit secF [Halospina denitrificans]|uniref:Protein-export membrane protein SecF n=1 Tax=Halospina denitrificans TaxID=332522 RepID=A0A4R7JTL7_9GAMM|nr:protein translocase subunit SecF [Halospina denitrificans]TDT41640.1 protein translocase subunit secF [Halospina denitrificans]